MEEIAWKSKSNTNVVFNATIMLHTHTHQNPVSIIFIFYFSLLFCFFIDSLMCFKLFCLSVSSLLVMRQIRISFFILHINKHTLNTCFHITIGLKPHLNTAVNSGIFELIKSANLFFFLHHFFARQSALEVITVFGIECFSIETVAKYDENKFFFLSFFFSFSPVDI